MLNTLAKTWTSGKSAQRTASRRSVHGGAPWVLSTDGETRQPQDGISAAADSRRVSEIGSKVSRELMEPEDARLTGGTRSLMRRLMGLNVGRVAPVSVKPSMAMKLKPVAGRVALMKQSQVA